MFEMNGVQKGASLLTLNHLRSSSRAKVALFGFRAFLEPPSVKASEVGENKNGYIKDNCPPNGKIVPRPSAEK